MVVYFNKQTKRLVKETEKLVAERLGVARSKFALFTNDPLEICFSTHEDDTYATLEIGDHDFVLEDALQNFMSDRRVEFMKEGRKLKKRSERGR